MILLFGGWEAYQSAPTLVVQEQIIVWSARLKAESDQYEQQQREIEAQRR